MSPHPSLLYNILTLFGLFLDISIGVHPARGHFTPPNMHPAAGASPHHHPHHAAMHSPHPSMNPHLQNMASPMMAGPGSPMGQIRGPMDSNCGIHMAMGGGGAGPAGGGGGGGTGGVVGAINNNGVVGSSSAYMGGEQQVLPSYDMAGTPSNNMYSGSMMDPSRSNAHGKSRYLQCGR